MKFEAKGKNYLTARHLALSNIKYGITAFRNDPQMRRLPHATWLRTFETAARHSSFASAALELGLTPAAVSQQIKLLEETLEVQLFKRLPKGVELTDIGQAYAQPVRASFQQLQSATNDLFRPIEKTTLRVRASISFCVLVLAPLLASFRTQHPEINVVLSTTVWSDRMDDQTIDLDIRYGNGDWDEQHVWPLGEGEATLVCSAKDAPAFAREPASLRSAEIVPIIGSEGDWPAFFETLMLGDTVPDPWLSVDSSLLALECIAGGRGVAITSRIFAQSYIQRGILAEPFSQSIKTRGNFYAVVPHGAKKQEQIDIFIAWLRTFAAQVR